jgi:hypothetical protein
MCAFERRVCGLIERAGTERQLGKVEESFAAIPEGVRAVHVVGRLAKGDLVRMPGLAARPSVAVAQPNAVE